jgi:cephalosporin hydroxylase
MGIIMTLNEIFKQECNQEIADQGIDLEIQNLSKDWINAANRHKYSYHFEWLGRPIIQYPQDMVALQEIIWNVKPDLIIETGIAHGGSLILSASMLAIIDYCKIRGGKIDREPPETMVLGIDIDIREHNRAAIESHPLSHKIKMIQGSSIDQTVINEVRKYTERFDNILVILDSNHTHDHVLAELKSYAPLVSIGSYCIVFDTVIEDMPHDMFSNRNWGVGDNPKTAVWEYMKTGNGFEIDRQIHDKLLVTVAPDGFLKRVS